MSESKKVSVKMVLEIDGWDSVKSADVSYQLSTLISNSKATVSELIILDA